MRSIAQLAAVVLFAVAAMAMLGVPTPALFGAMVASAAYALWCDRPPVLNRPAATSAQLVVGAAVGTRIEGASVTAVADQWLPITSCVVATIGVSVLFGCLFRLAGVPFATGAFAAVAGGASSVIAVAGAFGADDRIVAVFQYLRVVMILASLPLVVRLAGPDPAPRHGPAPEDGSPVSVFVTLTFTLAVFLGSWAVRIAPGGASVPGVLIGLVVTPMIGSAPWWHHAELSSVVVGAAFLALGLDVGLKFTRESMREVLRLLPVGILAIGLVIVSCAGIGIVLAGYTGSTRIDGYLATTPGGLPAVIAAASQAASDLTFVVAVQVFRIVVVMIVASFVSALKAQPRAD